MAKIPKHKEVRRKRIIAGIIAVSVIIVILASALAYYLMSMAKYDFDDTRSWFDKKGDAYGLNIFASTNGMGEFSDGTLSFLEGDYEYLFIYEWAYKGEIASDILVISPLFHTKDGIPEAFAAMRYENSTRYAYFFVDEDWKKEMPNTMLFWGDIYENEKEFSFNEAQKGVYYDKVEDKRGRIRGPGPLIGDLSRETQEKKTFVRIN